uniref:Acyltransferase n=1 Tax=Kwoniella dejecticola CBS 10117 TaxID=1296121 RepID=A0A1A6A7E8_9TREE|nr:acyltransferase [Kwoniella dejecticola CBS 10117]OBR85978.1 acyltransferase [Kwoniella dejecticola CBS 10117]
MSEKPLYTIPIDQRPPHGPWTSKVFFPLVFNFAQLGINSAQFLFVPLLLIPVVGRRWFDAAVGWTKDGYGRLLIVITVLFGPTSLVLTTDTPPSITNLVERDADGQMTKINLPDRLVVMANHQAYLDWMYLWILSCYAGHSRGIIILLKASLKKIPVIGWGMRFFRFIFMNRSWAADRDNLTLALTQLGHQARSGQEDHASETSGLLWPKKRSPLWLLIFPEGTIVSDEERVKSVRYAEREGVADFVTMLHPRSTGLLFCLRTLLPQVPDLQLLDVTIGYPGVPYGKYPQDWYGLFSVFFRSVPPPTVHIHLHLYSNLTSSTSEVPSLVSKPLAAGNDQPPSDTGLASPEETRAFELWLRGIWTAKEKRMERFYRDGRFESGEGGAREVVPVKQTKWYHWISAFGGGGMGTAAVVGVGIWQIAELLKSS